MVRENKERLSVKARGYYERNKEELLAKLKAKNDNLRAERRRTERLRYKEHVRNRGGWRKVTGYPYEVNAQGEVRRIGGSILIPQLDVHGYKKVHLRNRGKDRQRLVHALVLEAFVGRCPEGMEALHADGNPLNNQLSNLRWGTRAENRDDARRHGTLAMGSRIASAKLTEEEVKIIRRRARAGESQRKLCSEFGVSPAAMSNLVNKRTWKHVSD